MLYPVETEDVEIPLTPLVTVNVMKLSHLSNHLQEGTLYISPYAYLIGIYQKLKPEIG